MISRTFQFGGGLVGFTRRARETLRRLGALLDRNHVEEPRRAPPAAAGSQGKPSARDAASTPHKRRGMNRTTLAPSPQLELRGCPRTNQSEALSIALWIGVNTRGAPPAAFPESGIHCGLSGLACRAASAPGHEKKGRGKILEMSAFRGVSWGVVFLLGGGFALSLGIEKSGLI